MNLASLNTPTIANAGAALVAASSTGLGADILALTNGTHVATIALVAPLVGFLIGGFLAYVGKPSTLPPAQ